MIFALAREKTLLPEITSIVNINVQVIFCPVEHKPLSDVKFPLVNQQRFFDVFLYHDRKVFFVSIVRDYIFNVLQNFVMREINEDPP